MSFGWLSIRIKLLGIAVLFFISITTVWTRKDLSPGIIGVIMTNGFNLIEEHARTKLGMIKKDEVFYKIK
jgi:hypothetical protein